jgi:hypothetical protein
MNMLWAVVNEHGQVWFTRIGTEATPQGSVTIYQPNLNRAAIFETKGMAEEWAARNAMKQAGET